MSSETRKKMTLLIILSITVLFLQNIVIKKVDADGRAGVGVINVPPKYGKIRIVQQNNEYIRVYLTVSDYNSWGDIYQVYIQLKEKNTEETLSEFIYQQYENSDKFEKINKFIETTQKNLLVKEKCSFSSSKKRETIDQRCDIEILFVFKTTYFNRLKIVVKDRAGDKSTSEIDFLPTSFESQSRSNDALIIPFLNKPIYINLPPYFTNLSALISALIGVTIFIKSRKNKAIERKRYGNVS
ncbi:MAG: hypothetical protein V5A68_05005 [Candidatus Thermoplasmatota archaeon]